MSGHSKFANIKHKKEKNDAEKGKIFTIIGREIAVAVKEGGPDPSNNLPLQLRTADRTLIITQDCVMLLQKQKQIICLTTQLTEELKKQPEI